VREGKHGARSTKQAIAIGLSKARRAGVGLGAPRKGRASSEVRRRSRARRTRGGLPAGAQPSGARVRSAPWTARAVGGRAQGRPQSRSLSRRPSGLVSGLVWGPQRWEGSAREPVTLG
jgi:hypothetical protein